MAGKMVLHKLVVLGDGGVGKTALTIQITLGHFVETYDPTIEDSYRKQAVIDGQSCMLEVLDTAGQEEYTLLRDQWIRDGEAFLLVYSISSRSSFSRIHRFHSQVLRVKETSATSPSYPGSSYSESPHSTPLCLLVGNKCDRVTEREVSTQEGHTLAVKLGCDFVESSAKNYVNIEKAFYDLVRSLRRQRLQVASTGKNDSRSTPYRVKRHWWRKSIYISSNEGESEEGRKRLTYSLVNAAKSNHERELIAFLEAGANVNGQPGSDGAAIHAASASGHTNIINILLKKGAAINAKGPSGISPLQMAAAEGHLAAVRLLLHKGAQIDQTSQLHGSALSAAASRGRVAVVRFLLKKEANVSVVGGPYGNALQAAAWVGSSDIVEALLGAGADINALGDGDCTALQVAAFAGHSNVIRSLLDLGGALNIDSSSGKYGCALKAADDQGHFEAVTILLKAGAMPTLKSPVETPDTNDPVVAEEEETSEREQIGVHALTSPTPSCDWPLSASAPTLTKAASADYIPKPPGSQPAEKPTIHLVGFSCISNPIDAIVDIVFVHGLQGNPEKTWTHAPAPPKRRFFSSPSLELSRSVQEAVFWPYDLLSQHPEFSQARILTWGYDSKVISEFFGTSDQQNISQHGGDLMVALQQERKQNASRPLIFVAHSLGGILVKVALDNSKRSTHQPQYLPIYDSTKAIIFLGTPHGGSTSTNWGLLTSNLTKFALQGPSEKLLKGLKPNNEVLENLRKVFLQMLEDNKFKIHSFFETKPMLGVYGLNGRVVPYESAVVGHARQEIVQGINGNHSEICKFSSATDPGYRAVFGALEDYIIELKKDPS